MSSLRPFRSALALVALALVLGPLSRGAAADPPFVCNRVPIQTILSLWQTLKSQPQLTSEQQQDLAKVEDCLRSRGAMPDQKPAAPKPEPGTPKYQCANKTREKILADIQGMEKARLSPSVGYLQARDLDNGLIDAQGCLRQIDEEAIKNQPPPKLQPLPHLETSSNPVQAEAPEPASPQIEPPKSAPAQPAAPNQEVPAKLQSQPRSRGMAFDSFGRAVTVDPKWKERLWNRLTPSSPTSYGEASLREMKRVEDLAPLAQQNRQEAADRLANYDAAVAKQDLADLKKGLEADRERAAQEAADRRAEMGPVARSTVTQLDAVAKEAAKLYDAGLVAQQLQALPWLKDSAVTVEAVARSPQRMREGLERIDQRQASQQAASRTDYLTLVEGAVTVAVAGAIVPGGLLDNVTASDAPFDGQKVLARQGMYMALADLLVKQSLIDGSLGSYQEIADSLRDLEATQPLQRKRLELEIKKAEMQAQQLKEMAERFNALGYPVEVSP